MVESMDKSRWYTLQVMSGQERRVKDYLLNRRQQDLANGVDNGLVEVLVPTTRVLERKNGRDYRMVTFGSDSLCRFIGSTVIQFGYHCFIWMSDGNHDISV